MRRQELMEPDRDWLMRSLRDQLALLAMPGEAALAQLPAGCVKADELALDFENYYRAVVGNFGNELASAALGELEAIDKLFDEMLAPANPALWTDEAVVNHPVWAEVRRRATLALQHLVP